MPTLSVIHGGGGAGPQPRKPSARAQRKATQKAARLKKYDLDADQMFFVLPAPTREEIAYRLSMRLQRVIEVYYVDILLAHVRDHVWRLGWTAVFAPPGPNPKLLDRYQPALVMAGGRLFTDVEIKSVEDGLEAQATVIVTKTRRYAAMLRVAAKQYANKARGRSMVDFADDLEYFHRKTAKFRDDVLAV